MIRGSLCRFLCKGCYKISLDNMEFLVVVVVARDKLFINIYDFLLITMFSCIFGWSFSLIRCILVSIGYFYQLDFAKHTME